MERLSRRYHGAEAITFAPCVLIQAKVRFIYDLGTPSTRLSVRRKAGPRHQQLSLVGAAPFNQWVTVATSIQALLEM